jgi:hypothetical protein
MLMFQIFAALLPCLGDVLGAKDSFHLSYLHGYLLPPMDSLVAAEPDDYTKPW